MHICITLPLSSLEMGILIFLYAVLHYTLHGQIENPRFSFALK